MSSQPVYRRPRSHAYSCRCPRCVQFLNRPSASGSGGFWAVVALMVLYGLPAGIWHQGTGMVVACAIWWPVLTAVTALIAYGSYREKHPAPRKAPPSGPPVSSPPPAPRPGPACRHRNAVPVDNLLGGKPWAYWCEECGTQIDADSGLPMPAANPAPRCCGAPPGAGHWGNCPRRKR